MNSRLSSLAARAAGWVLDNPGAIVFFMLPGAVVEAASHLGWLPHEVRSVAIVAAFLAGALVSLQLLGQRLSRSSGLWFFGLVLGLRLLPMLLAIGYRTLTGDPVGVHDGLLQAESAARLVMGGQDPYGADYSGTDMAQIPWLLGGVNPALHHLAYWPLVVILLVPVELVSTIFSVVVDPRLLLLVMWGVAAYAVARLPVSRPARLGLLAILLLSADWAAIEGRNDIAYMAPLLLACLDLSLARSRRAWVWLGLAIALKPFAVLCVPLFAAWELGAHRRGERRDRAVSGVLLASLIVLVPMIPFVLWSPSAFVTDTVGYTLLGGTGAYPVNGVGLGSLLVSLGVLRTGSAPFPFALIQLAGLAVTLFPLTRIVWRRPRLATVAAGFAMSLAAVTILGRFTNTNYLASSLLFAMIAVALTLRPGEGYRGPETPIE
ncbi:MAG: hypothetical protein ACYDAY_07030 [Candidatus Dormibacteria bacterium]